MKDLKAFLEDLATNENLSKKFEGIKKSADIVALAKEEGYEFTKKEYDNAMLEMVSGGGIGDAIWGAVKQGVADGASAAWDAVTGNGSNQDPPGIYQTYDQNGAPIWTDGRNYYKKSTSGKWYIYDYNLSQYVPWQP